MLTSDKTFNYLNLGCGRRFHNAWTNIDFTSTDESIIVHNLVQGIPFPDASFDVVYHSHVLEHFTKSSADFFLKECYRVLSPQGVIRVVVPDLEQIAITYLLALEKARSGSPEWVDNYEWILLEMYDQTIRSKSGGEMGKYLSKELISNREFVIQRIGAEGKNFILSAEQRRNNKQDKPLSESEIKQFFKKLYRFLRYPTYRWETLLKLLLGKEYIALEIGRFRQGGEVHQWMYDNYSLKTLLDKCGFQNIIQQTASASYIPNWTSFNLDTEVDGSVYKPDSIFMEAIK